VSVHAIDQLAGCYVAFRFDPGDFRIGATATLLSESRQIYSAWTGDRQDRPPLLNVVVIYPGEQLSDEDYGWMEWTARQVGVHLSLLYGDV